MQMLTSLGVARPTAADDPPPGGQHDMRWYKTPPSDEASEPVQQNRAPRFVGGGVHYDTARVMGERLLRTREGRLLRREIERLCEKLLVGTGTKQSPRWDMRRVITELKSKRMAIARARREEVERPVVVLMADVSGSCSSVAIPTLCAGLDVAEGMRDVVVVAHTNGMPVFAAGSAAKKAFPKAPASTVRMEPGTEGQVGTVSGYAPGRGYMSDHAEAIHVGYRIAGNAVESIAAYRDMFRLKVAAVVAFGDWDAGWLYGWMTQRAPLIWLDSKKEYPPTGPRPAGERLRMYDKKDFARKLSVDGFCSSTELAAVGGELFRIKPVAHWEGVNGAADAVVALRKIRTIADWKRK